MTVLLFSLRNVPDDEAEEIRQLLASNGIEFYETPAGKWGISSPGIWLNDRDELPKARSLVEAYQKERFVSRRREFESLKKQGRHKTIVHAIAENPLRFVFYLVVIGIVLYLSSCRSFGWVAEHASEIASSLALLAMTLVQGFPNQSHTLPELKFPSDCHWSWFPGKRTR